MHFYFITRGIRKDVQDFIDQLNAKYVPLDMRDEHGNKIPNQQYRLAVRPIQLWEINYPKEWQDVVLSTVLGKDGLRLQGNDGKKPVVHKWVEKYLFILRKMLKLKPIPKYNEDRFLPIEKHVNAIGIGIKDDYFGENGMEGL